MREQKKRNRLLDALAGKGAPIPEESYTEVSLKEMAQTLKTVPGEVWGKYAFAREPLEGRFTEMQKEDYIKKANACGREWADKNDCPVSDEKFKPISGLHGTAGEKDNNSDRRGRCFVCSICSAK